MEKLKSMKEMLMNCAQSQMGHLDNVDAKEMGEVIDMIKDLEEAIYYCTITKSMNEPKHHYVEYYPERYRDSEKQYGKMYYPYYPRYDEVMYYGDENGGSSSSRMYEERPLSIARDRREGRSSMTRKTYMEGKEMHHDKVSQMKELEKYMMDLTKDITEMIEGASVDEKQLLQSKISTLASKIQ